MHNPETHVTFGTRHITIVVGLFFRPIKYAAHVTRWTLSVPLRLDVFEIFDLCCLFVFIYMSCHESTFCKPLSCKLFSFRYHWSDLFFVLTIWVIRIFFIDMNGLPLASTCATQMYFLVTLEKTECTIQRHMLHSAHDTQRRQTKQSKNTHTQKIKTMSTTNLTKKYICLAQVLARGKPFMSIKKMRITHIVKTKKRSDQW
jgi:hypothetical protein